MNQKFFVTTPIYYVNDVPHVGHTYTTLAADVIARYYRQIFGKNRVFFLTGTDEHGQKVAEAAKKHGQTPKEYCDLLAPQFQKAWKDFDFSFDYFIRTTDPRHEKIVQEILQKIYDKNLIYRGKYKGLYCLGCEKFIMENDLVEGKCPYHPNTKPITKEEKNYFFKLSAFKDKLIKAITDKNDLNHYLILPKERENEILGKLKRGLVDISVTREGITWGIKTPWDKTQTIYVWVEALFNYYTATQFLENEKDFWPPDLHLMAKDILWFHSVIWEALLLAADLPLPKTVFAHGFFTVNGQKMSKSLGNVISPKQLIENFGVDGSRYLLLSAFPFGADGDISLTKFKAVYNADLANGLGNLIARVAKLCERSGFSFETKEKYYQDHLISKLIEGCRFNDALGRIWSYIDKTNEIIDHSQPWNQKGKVLKQTLQSLVFAIREIAFNLKPFLPETAEKIEKQFSQPKIISQPPLFKRLK